MQFLALLFLMLGVIVIMVASILGLSYGVGVYWYSREGPVVPPADPDPCAQCEADHGWYHGLPIWKRNVISVWWWVNRLIWASKGCK